jgi:UDP-N-acetylglucosamine 4,6-dehydratase
MTRFVLTLQESVDFVLAALVDMRGGEVFVPKLPTVTVGTIAAAVSWPAKPETVRVERRPGEKTHELLVSGNEARRAEDQGGRFVIHPAGSGRDFPGGMEYGSDSPLAERLSVAGFRALAGLGATLEATA